MNMRDLITLCETPDPSLIATALPWTMRIAAANGHGQDKQWCEDRLKTVFSEISQRFRGDTICIWRAITLPEGEAPDPNKHPGIYWTWDQDAIHPAHGKRGDSVYVYAAETTSDQIDWESTLAQNAVPSYEGEKEIRLISRGRVEIIDVRDMGEVK
jgi:hypothetical protein